MLLLKTNPELKKVFGTLVKTIKVPVTWTDVFVITNNSLILAGDVRSLIFNFDTKKVSTNIVEIPPESASLESMPNDALLNNVMNIVMYAFGKWGVVSGLKVEKGYTALNELFTSVLRPISVEPQLNRDNMRFFKNDMQITFEDTLLAVLRLLKNEGKLKERQSLATSDTKDEEETSSQSASGKDKGTPEEYEELEDDDDYKIGLWHNMCWKKEICEFRKAPQNNSDSSRSRIGNDFYITNYLCPGCGEKLYLGVYPVNKEILIETDEGRVFMARTYACRECNTFYTPRPEKLLQEGDVYSLKFDEDSVAFEDYLDILGRKAARTTNSKFNEFETTRSGEKEPDDDAAETPSSGHSSGIKSLKKLFTKKPKTADAPESEPQTDTEQPAAMQSDMPQTDTLQTDMLPDNALSEEESFNDAPEELLTNSFKDLQEQLRNEKKQLEAALQETTENIPVQAADKTSKTVPAQATKETAKTAAAQNPEAAAAQTPKAAAAQTSKTAAAQTSKTAAAQTSKTAAANLSRILNKTPDELKIILTKLTRANEAAQAQSATKPPHSGHIEAVKKILHNKLTAQYDAQIASLDKLTTGQLSDLKQQIAQEAVLSAEEKQAYTSKLDSRLNRAKEIALGQTIELSKNKTYAEINQIIGDVETLEIPDEAKQDALKTLQRIKSDRATREIEHLLTHMPLHMDRKQLSAYIDKLSQYKDIDLTPYRKQLEQRMDMAETEEITAMVNRGGKKDRTALWNLYEELLQSEYSQKNLEPFLDKIYEKIRRMDEAKIESICPSIVTLSFADGLKAYEKISQGIFLPELKTNTLEMIQRRLTKLKTDESVQLMRKLKRDMEEKLPEREGFYFYDAREELKKAQNAKAQGSMAESGAEEGAEENTQPEDSYRDAMLRAVNGYASRRGQYEYPLMVCDTSRSKNGKEGFVLTPDHIFIHTFLNSGIIAVTDIDKIKSSRKVFGKGIFIKNFGEQKSKLPVTLAPKNWKVFAEILDGFIDYLQEKPESRSIEYMAKEKHDVIRCYRCGYTYKGGNVCPKCGSKTNR